MGIRESCHVTLQALCVQFPAMDGLFKMLGVLVAIYVVHALVTGEVFAKWRWSGRWFRRDENADMYWSTVVIYGLLSLALVFVF